jgi:ASC-1-like (ASCH) protein
MATHHFRVFAELLPLIESGAKQYEIRANAGRFARVNEGDHIVFNGMLTRLVENVSVYPNVTALLQHVPARHMWPGKTEEELRVIFRKVIGNAEEFGARAFKLSKPKSAAVSGNCP